MTKMWVSADYDHVILMYPDGTRDVFSGVTDTWHYANSIIVRTYANQLFEHYIYLGEI